MDARPADARSVHTDHSIESSESDILFFPTSSSARNSADVAPEKGSGDTIRASPKPYTATPSHLRHQGSHEDEDATPDAESQPLTSNERSGTSTPYRDDIAPAFVHRVGSNTFSQSLDPRTYWRLAEQASHAPSTRSLERQSGGTLAERQEAYWKAGVVNILLILCWYAFSTAISVYNKWMFDTTKHHFSFPLFVTSWHMMMQFGLSSLALRLFPSCVPRKANGTPSRPSGANWATKVVPCALATAFDIGLSNTSLKTITLTFYTMCKSSNLAFVLFFAFVFGLEVIRWSLIGIIALITVGVVMMVAAETKFVLTGAVQVLTASALGGLRWALTQILLDREEMGMSNPVATVFWLAPIMGVALISLSAAFESWYAIFAAKSGYFDTWAHAIGTIGLMAGPGFLAFGMNLSEFALIKRTSVVTLSVAGIFKEVLTIALASSVFGDELTPINVTGLCITLLGIGMYNFLKYRLITRGADSVGQGISGLNELGDSIRSRASSIFGTTQPSAPRDNDYEQVGEDENSLLFDEGRERGKVRRNMTGESDALELDTQRVSQEIVERGARVVSDEERERLRKIEEEADLSGWGTSGERVTGQGLVEEHHHARYR
ncbi:Triose-phosphate transporter domain protein [Kalmanozyma brasiliensis GHG001]|uniref:Sugar phosphate transporter domain-containing protein n=1 Tax=Kalmanozyma brasiliensis (strain GHG001) TaxID=1365824 RepID=V5ECX6_KALBG|nr:Triose-phosphate transporter domain protein [Kalmanozyma brasiliensis GHG001]EST08311.1 Triose-phosphate transporter domain protein [Kalmanozyma brasiliensis GHG001]